ncbi:hypothetical protein SNEBB_005335 [Seison nebaliae]|nr:hypothetical protein SNEBB_005335 [Seison nebaliae]
MSLISLPDSEEFYEKNRINFINNSKSANKSKIKSFAKHKAGLLANICPSTNERNLLSDDGKFLSDESEKGQNSNKLLHDQLSKLMNTKQYERDLLSLAYNRATINANDEQVKELSNNCIKSIRRSRTQFIKLKERSSTDVSKSQVNNIPSKLLNLMNNENGENGTIKKLIFLKKNHQFRNSGVNLYSEIQPKFFRSQTAFPKLKKNNSNSSLFLTHSKDFNDNESKRTKVKTPCNTSVNSIRSNQITKLENHEMTRSTPDQELLQPTSNQSSRKECEEKLEFISYDDLMNSIDNQKIEGTPRLLKTRQILEKNQSEIIPRIIRRKTRQIIPPQYSELTLLDDTKQKYSALSLRLTNDYQQSELIVHKRKKRNNSTNSAISLQNSQQKLMNRNQRSERTSFNNQQNGDLIKIEKIENSSQFQ